MKLDYSVLEAIKRIYLPDVVRSYNLPIKEIHAESFSMLCPFHDDKNPSLHINHKKGKWLWNCFGCRQSGNTLDFVMKYEKITFGEAYTKLLPLAGGEPLQPGQSPLRQLPQEPEPEGSILNRQELLKRVIDYYHQTFFEDRRGIEYLSKRGIKDEELYRSFKIGYVDGSLRGTLPANDDNEVTQTLRATGILNQKGNEHFYNCVVFPITDENGCIVGIYGRNAADSEPKHLYLPGPHKGVWNFQTLKASREIVLTESVIDAASCMALGMNNVVPIYGVNGLTEDHLKCFREYRTEKIHLCFDNDTPGASARQYIKEELMPLGIEVADIVLPKEYKDINEALQKGYSGEAFRVLFSANIGLQTENAGSKENGAWPKVDCQQNAITISFPLRTYRIRGLEAKNLDRMRVNIKVQQEEAYHLDSLDLYQSRARATFCGQCRKIMEADEGELLQELNKIIYELEKVQAKNVDVSSDQSQPEEMGEAERIVAIEQLKSPTLFSDILIDMESMGYVGEMSNKAIGYLVAISRKLEDPLSCVIISQSSAGKSALADVVEKLVPPEECLMYSRVTPQALYYMDKDALKRKLLMIEESVGADSADYSIRTLQSKKKLTQAVPIKDPQTGKIRTVSFEVEGPIAYIETTTRPRINQENATRCFELYLDESKEQTSRIQQAQKESKTLNGLKKHVTRDWLIRKHQNMQRLLQEVKVVNPFANLLDFPVDWLRTRRDNLRFLNLIEAITFLHQYQRPIKKEDGQAYIESTMEDYKTAYLLAREVLGESFTELKKPQRELLEKVEKLLADKEAVTRREIRESTGLPDHRLRDLLAELVSLEYLQAAEGKQGKSYQYRLAERGVSGEKIFVGLTSPDALAAKIGSFVYPQVEPNFAVLRETSPRS